MGDEAQLEEGLQRLEALLARVEAMPPTDGDVAREAVAALADVYGEALRRAVVVSAAAPDGPDRLAADPLVGHLMALHGIHPQPVEQRVEQALSEMRAHVAGDGSLRLQGIQGGVARVDVPTGGCGSPTLGPAVRDILLGAAPELADVEAVPAAPAPAFIPLTAVQRRAGR